MRSLSVLLTACSALVLAGCGSGSPAAAKIDPATAAQLADESDAIADRVDAHDVCGAAHRADELRARVDAAIAAGSVPRSLAPELRSNVRALVDQLNCPPQPPPQEGDHGKGREKHKKKGSD